MGFTTTNINSRADWSEYCPVRSLSKCACDRWRNCIFCYSEEIEIENLIQPTSGKWEPEPPADPRIIATACSASGFEWPLAYRIFLAFSNGGVADLPIEPGRIELWRAEDVVERNEGYKVSEYLPDYWAK